MKCFEVWINDTMVGLIGRPDAEALYAQIETSNEVAGAVLELTALLPARDGHAAYATWGTRTASAGDEIRIRIIDGVEADPSVTVVHDYGAEQTRTSVDWPLCSFCGRSYHDAHAMVSGRRGYICDLCIDEVSKLGDNH